MTMFLPLRVRSEIAGQAGVPHPKGLSTAPPLSSLSVVEAGVAL